MYHVEVEVNDRVNGMADRKNDVESCSRLDSREASSATNNRHSSIGFQAE